MSSENFSPLTIDQIVETHSQAVYGYAFRLSGSPQDAEDLTQQTFLTAHRKIDQLREPERIKSWLLTITRNLFLKQCRKKAPINWDNEWLDAIPEDSPALDGPYDIEQLQTALAELPEPQRLILLMFYFEELPYKEIAEQLDVPLGTVMSRLARAKQVLRARLEKSGP
jgi:RNA polymerase sigma-70 factor, ECF subfamily